MYGSGIQTLPDARTANGLLKSLVSEGKASEAKSLLHSLEERNCEITAFHYSTIVNAFRRASDWQTAVGMLTRMVQRKIQQDIVVYNQAINACARAASWQSALQLLAMLQGSLSPDSFTLNGVLAACSAGEQWQIGIQLISTMRALQMADAISFNSALRGCANSKQWSRALCLMQDMIEGLFSVDKITYTTVLSSLEHEWQLAMHLLQDMDRRQIQPDCLVCTAAVAICGRAFCWQEAARIFDQALAGGMPCDTPAYNALITAYGLGMQWEASLSLMHAMQGRKQADSITLSAAISACCDAGHWQSALRLLGATNQGRLNNSCYNAILGRCSWEAGLAVLDQMDLQKVEKDSLTYSTAIAALEQADKWEEAFRLLDERLVKTGDDRIRRPPFAPRSFLREVLPSEAGKALDLRRMVRSCSRASPIAFRVNPLKARQDVLDRLRRQGWQTSPLPWLGNGFLIQGRPPAGLSRPQLTGELYFQEPTSMLPAELLRLVMTESLAELKDPPSLTVLDLCAAPGSKSTQLGSWLMSMEPMGFLVANEPDEARAKKLDASLTRMAVTNSIVCTMDGRFISDLVPEAFDAVLVDVPCTCEGNVRKDATSLLRAAGTMRTGPAQHKEELVDRQQAILQSAWRALRPGGCLVQSECGSDPDHATHL
ncbi:unnamed protein product [Durusdinium trenchii]|uniref:SAM-dependent MTase RsmB/NOP-type domain-containing protein n=1 Tax=Durusdinium trenchii TaxID=1381693 RepID=A0ABP0Q0D4_9DINO